MRSVYTMLMSSCAMAAFAFTAPNADAQTAEELQAQVDELKAGLAALEAQLAAQKAQQDQEQAEVDDDLERLNARTDEIARMGPSEGPAEGMMVGDTLVKVGGMIDLDVNVTELSDGEFASNSVARDFYIPGATPIGGTAEDSPDTDFTAESSRFFMTASRSTGERNISGRIELDFLLSAQGNERVSNSFAPRLRHAFVNVDNVAGGELMVGQNWSTFQNTSSIVESASFLALSDGIIFIRQPQIRYTRGNWQFALENNNTRDLGLGGPNVADDGFIPDIVARRNFRGDWGNASIAVLGRHLVDEGEQTNGQEVEDTGWGVSLAGDVNLTSDTGVKFSLSGGEGVGRYIGLNAVADARVTQDTNGNVDLEAISSVGGLVALRHKWSPKTRSTIGWSGLFADAEIGETESVQSVLAVLAHDIAPRTTIAGEILYGQRTISAAPGIDDEGDIFRITFSTKYSF